MKKNLILLILVICITGLTSGQTISNKRDSLTLSQQLQLLCSIPALPQYLDQTIEAQTSTYDITGGNNDGFSGTYSYLRKDALGDLVMFDQKGPGVINRFWTPTPTEDTLDFYIDDTTRPSLSVKYSDLFSGTSYPFIPPIVGSHLGGYYCYFPIIFEKRCIVVSRGAKLQFHQIQYRLYPSGTYARSFTPRLSKEESNTLQRVSSLWNGKLPNISEVYPQVSRINKPFSIRNGDSIALFTATQGGRIVAIELDSAQTFAGRYKDIDIRITWDDDPTPAVDCPVADFFGYAFGQPAMHSLLLGTNNDRDYCYFPMPFDHSARIELISRQSPNSRTQVNSRITILYTNDERKPAAEGKFHAWWNSSRMNQDDPPYTLLDIVGRGHYVGTILQAQGLTPGMTTFFEGDDSTATDDHFRIHGTGSEDYFNGGWYACPDRWDQRLSLPIHGSLTYSLPLCRTGGYRFYLSDKIPFRHHFFQSIEHGLTAKGVPAIYTSICLYYDDTTAPIQPPSPALTTVYEPDTLMLYPQLMQYTVWGSMDMKTSNRYKTGGRSYVYSPENDGRLKIALEGIPDGTYKVYGDIVKFSSGCTFSVWQGQTRLSNWIDTYQTDSLRQNALYLCTLGVDAREPATNSINFTFRTTDQHNSLFMNRLIFIKQ